MAKNNNLKDFVTDIADAIRAKKGTTDLINPQDFATEIGAISGGSGEGGGSNVEYLDVRGLGLLNMEALTVAAVLIKAYIDNSISVVPYAIFSTVQEKEAFAFAVDFSLEIAVPEFGTITAKQLLIMQGMPEAELDSIPRITKEQFYDLNA